MEEPIAEAPVELIFKDSATITEKVYVFKDPDWDSEASGFDGPGTTSTGINKKIRDLNTVSYQYYRLNNKLSQASIFNPLLNRILVQFVIVHFFNYNTVV